MVPTALLLLVIAFVFTFNIIAFPKCLSILKPFPLLSHKNNNHHHHHHHYHDKPFPVTTAWRVLRLRMGEGTPDMEGICEYIEQAVTESRHGEVLQLGG